MEEQQTVFGLEPIPVQPSQSLPESNPSSKPIFGRKLGKRNSAAFGGVGGNPKLRLINRNKIIVKQIDVERMLECGHPARAMWDLMGKVDLGLFHNAIRSQEGEKGRPSNDPRMLISVWLYAYSIGVSAGREIERQMEYEPGLMWLCGGDAVNHHTLSDFRVDHKEALDELFQQWLAVLYGEGLIDLSQVMHDGTKVRANAGVDTFRRKKTIEERLALAKQLLEQMGDPREDNQQARTRKQAAEQRAARELEEKTDAALEEWKRISKDKTAAVAERVRVSVVEPEAHKMKHGDNAILPSYNVQLSTESSHKIIVGMHLSQSSADAQSLVTAVDVIEENTGRCPDQMVIDGGFTSKENIAAMDERGIDLIGSFGARVESAFAGLGKEAYGGSGGGGNRTGVWRAVFHFRGTDQYSEVPGRQSAEL